jgi:hypothetical protein
VRLLGRQVRVARGVPLLSAGLGLALGFTGWTTAIAPDDSTRPISSSEPVAKMDMPANHPGAQKTPAAELSIDAATPDELHGAQASFSSQRASERAAGQAVTDAPEQPTGAAAPQVQVRIGDHRDFERVVFEWPEPVEHTVVHRGDQVVIGFGRPGRIDLARLRDGFGRRLLEAWTEGGDTTGEVVLRVVPDAKVRAFSLEDDRIVAVDVSGDTAPRSAAAAASKPPSIKMASQEHVTEFPGLVTESRSRADHAPVQPSADVASDVEVRMGDHGDFERVVFEWSEPVEHQVAHRGDQVVVAFGRRGRFDLAALRERLGHRVVDAWAEGETTSRVVLRVAPDARVRSFGLNDGRVVVLDVSAATARQPLARSITDPVGNTVGELRQSLEQRDAVIENLLARVEQLERRQVLSSGDLDQVVAGGIGSVAASVEAPLPSPGAEGTSVAQAPSSPPPAPSAPSEGEPTAASQAQGGGAANAPTKPGQFEVEQDELDRALERTLVQTGVLLLPVGQFEVEPFFSYTRRESDAPALAMLNGAPAGAEIEVRRNEFVSGQDLRFGLPFDSQVEFELPYRLVEQSTVTKVGFSERDETDAVGQGMGDFSIGLAKTLAREDGHWWPDLVGRITWDADTGKTSSNGVPLGSGFNELSGGLSAVKRQDPLAFVGGVSYETTFENDNVKPGDELGFTIGTVLAASPATSLRLALGQRFVDNSQVDGEGINGSESVIGTATFGASVILGRGMLLDVAADIGLTDDAPDYAARASLPIRFDMPVF